MDQAFIDILKQLVKEQGNTALTDAKKCKALLADYTRNEYKKQSRLLILTVEEGLSKVIEGAENISACKKAQIKELEEEHGINSAFAADIVDALAFILRGDTSKSVTTTPAVEKADASPAPQQQQSSSTESSLPPNFTGKGKKTYKSGNVYEGDLKYGRPHGKGKMTYANGNVYEGDYDIGFATKGKMKFADGRVYEGDFKNFDPWGKGKMIFADGRVFEGDFVNGYPNGKMKVTWPDGKIEKGNWKNGEFKKGLFG